MKLRRRADPADLGSVLLEWSQTGTPEAIAALCEEVARSNVELLERALFALLDRDDSSLAPTLDVVVGAIGRARCRSQIADLA